MARISRSVVETLYRILGARSGVESIVREIAMNEKRDVEPITSEFIVSGNIPAASGARVRDHRQPSLHLYCEKISNLQREKFRSFSGVARMVIEISASDESAVILDRNVQIYAEAITEVLERNRGDWGQGISYGGNYEVQFGPVKSGGRNYTQTTKVILEVQVSQPNSAG